MTASINEEKIVFIHQLDTYEMNAIERCLLKENITQNCTKYKIIGTVIEPENIFKIMPPRQPLDILSTGEHSFIQKVLESDVMIFNAASPNFEDVCFHIRQVIIALEKWTEEQKKLILPDTSPEKKKYLILSSTPMTWGLTKNEIPEEEDGELIEELLYEDDYRRRRASKAYCKHKLLERDVIWVQKKCKHFVKSLVVCPGVMYGDENETFHYIFKFGFYNKIVPILNPGSQKIPMIYVRDFGKMMMQLINVFPEAKVRYIFAVQPQTITLKTFTYNMCKSFNGDCSQVRFLSDVEMTMMDKNLFAPPTLPLLALDIIMVPTYFKNFPFREVTEDLWNDLAHEFRVARNLKPLKLVIDGPPLVGKTEHALKLAEYYNLLYIDIRQIVYEYIKYLEHKIDNSIIVVESFECPDDVKMYAEEDKPRVHKIVGGGPQKLTEEDNRLVLELKQNMERWSKRLFKLKVHVASHKTFEDQDFQQIVDCIIALLSTEQFDKNQGYVIDGFPFNYEQANQIYFNTRKVLRESAKSITLDEIETPPEVPQILKPTHFIVFDATDEVLCNRALDFSETEAIMRRCLRQQMLPRLDSYRERNDEPQCLTNLFYDNDLIPIHVTVDSSSTLLDTLRTLKTSIGHPFIYPMTKEEQKAHNEAIAEAIQKENDEQRRKKEEFIKTLKAEREHKITDWSAKYEELRKHENEMREVKTMPLRQYLAKYVLPTLSEGILKIAELKPDDPVDFLAEYLFKCNPVGQQTPPFCTEEQRKRFYETFSDDLQSDSDYAVTLSQLMRTECSEFCPKNEE